MKKLLLATAIACVMLSAPAHAEATRLGTCSGKLSRLPEGEWVIRTGREGICTFRDEAVKIKVLATCFAGRGCEVTGSIGECEDSGECSEVRSVQRVRSR
jgi:hypothetical protein